MDDYEAIRARAATALARLDPLKPFGTPLLNAMSRVTPQIAYECVALRRDRQGIEVFLIRRPDDDTCFPGHWHAPGSILRNKEQDEDVFTRLASREFQTNFLEPPVFVGHWNNPDKEPRGHFLHLIFSVQKMQPHQRKDACWFFVNNLPEMIVPYHKDKIIPMAIMEAFSTVASL